jgi:type III secretion protein S
MTESILSITTEALWLVLLLSAPPIVAASAVGLLVAIVQAATQLQEQTLQYTLKFFAVVATLFITAGLLAGSLYTFSDQIFSNFPGMIRG